MQRSLLFLMLLFAFLLPGCADENSSAPSSGGVHPADWYVTHRATSDTAECSSCHGANLKGSGSVPSCFTASYEGLNCHAQGPGTVPHPLDGTYLHGSNHGPDAKADLTACQICHSPDSTAGPGSNPRFNLGIAAAGGNGCESCHGQYYAHPADWAGPNNTFHYSADNIQEACTLCHGSELDGEGGVGVSCVGCHTETTAFTLDCTFCHEYPPDEVDNDLDVPTPVEHGNVSNVSLHDECVVCHGMKEDTAGGNFTAATNYNLFDPATDTPGDHWDGNINMNSGTEYNQDNFGCDAAGCHGNSEAFQLSDSGLNVELEAYSSGATVPHPLNDNTFLTEGHGDAAKGLSASTPNGIADCQPCHASPANGANPRFNVGINRAGGNGCESCHGPFLAHPLNWFDGELTHSDIPDDKFEIMCTLCHGADLDGIGGVSGAGGCNDCHIADPITNAGCVSCHSTPPDGATGIAGDIRPNREGRHGEDRHTYACAVCHNSVGFNTTAHFDFSEPADVVIQDGFGAPAGTGSYDPVTGDCSNIVCHGGSGTIVGPWY